MVITVQEFRPSASQAQPASSMEMPAAALFDLDGTLIDSVPDITLAVAELLGSEQLPALDEVQVRRMVGHGIRGLVRRVYIAQGIALDEDSLDQRTDSMLQIYPRFLTGRTTLMPAVLESLDFLAANHCRLAVVTNKPQHAAQAVLEHFHIARRFAVIVGDGAGRELARKPDPAMLHFALDSLGVQPADAIMIGDSGIDIDAARAAGIRSVAVRGGYSTEPLERFNPDLVIDNLAGLSSAMSPL